MEILASQEMTREEAMDCRVGVLMGGPSSERAISLQTGAGVLGALQSLGYDAHPIDWSSNESLPALLGREGVQLVWNALHGTCGEDGAVQGLLRCLDIPCTGSGILASAMAMDKIAAKQSFRAQDIATPRGQVWNPGVEINLRYPLVAKPANEGSSVGVSIVPSPEELVDAVALASMHQGPVLLEEFIDGHEVFVGILDGKSLGTIEVKTSSGFYDYAAKYTRGDTQYLIPATLDAAVCERLEDLALRAHKALGCHSYSRVDIRVNHEGEGFVLEVNTLPGMTGASLMPKLAAKAGISYGELCERVLLTAR